MPPTLGVGVIISFRFRRRHPRGALGRVGRRRRGELLGPLAGGSIESLLGWRAVIALPMLGAFLVLLWRFLPTEGSGARLDLLGAALVAVRRPVSSSLSCSPRRPAPSWPP